MLEVNNYGSLVIVNPLDADALEWLESHTDGQWWAGGLVVEPRYLDALLEEAINEGLEVI